VLDNDVIFIITNFIKGRFWFRNYSPLLIL
jgi:hypothetical protein